MHHSLPILPASRRIIMLIGILFLATITLTSCAQTDETPAADQRENSPDVVFDGETYSYEAFERDIAPLHERIVILDSRWVDGEDRDVWFAFSTTEALEAFAAENGVDLDGDSVQDSVPTTNR